MSLKNETKKKKGIEKSKYDMTISHHPERILS
jgi:hypothetical protein